LQQKVAEVGFGNGGLLRSLATLFSVCYGLDISKKNIELTQSKFLEDGIHNVIFEPYDILDKPKFANEFDAVVLSHVLEHFDDSSLKILLSNVKLMLKSDGVFFGATPYLKPFNRRICPDCGCIFEIDGHNQVFNDDKMKRLLEGNGFKVVLIRHFNPEHYHVGLSLMTRFFHNCVHVLFRQDLTQLEFIAIPK
jgi:SAM-dependent methyltransferase